MTLYYAFCKSNGSCLPFPSTLHFYQVAREVTSLCFSLIKEQDAIKNLLASSSLTVNNLNSVFLFGCLEQSTTYRKARMSHVLFQTLFILCSMRELASCIQQRMTNNHQLATYKYKGFIVFVFLSSHEFLLCNKLL